MIGIRNDQFMGFDVYLFNTWPCTHTASSIFLGGGDLSTFLAFPTLQKLSSMTRGQVLQHVSSFREDMHPMVRTACVRILILVVTTFCIRNFDVSSSRWYHARCRNPGFAVACGERVLVNNCDCISLAFKWFVKVVMLLPSFQVSMIRYGALIMWITVLSAACVATYTICPYSRYMCRVAGSFLSLIHFLNSSTN